MPKNVLPEAARVLPKAGQTVWMKAFNDALDGGMDEDEASKMGWAAAKRAGYSKGENGKWSKVMGSELFLDENDGFQISVPLIKIDTKKRIVGGFATLNNVDEAGDVVEPDASLEAFSKWFGNIREMHQPKAVGKAVDFYPDTYTDKDGNEYEGMWVNAKISKGAEDTWEKILDGTLSGFSIGGATLAKERDIVKDESGEKRQIWRITKYRLTELSLVDSPCNRLASISLVKSIDGAPVVEDVVEDLEEEEEGFQKSWGDGEFVDLSSDYKGVVTALESLRDSAIRSKADDVAACASHSLSEYRRKVRWEIQEADYQNGIVSKDDAANNDLKKDEENMSADLQNESVSDNSNSTELTEDEKSIFQKFVNFLKSDDAGTESTDDVSNTEGGSSVDAEELTKAVDAVKDELIKANDDKFAEIATSFTEIKDLFEKVATSEGVDEIKKEIEGKLEDIAGRVEALETSGAIKKSGDDAGKTGDDLKKSDEGTFWADSILPEFARNAGK